MIRSPRTLTMLAVACASPAFACVMAQDAKKAEPAAAASTIVIDGPRAATVKVEVKAQDVKKADAKAAVNAGDAKAKDAVKNAKVVESRTTIRIAPAAAAVRMIQVAPAMRVMAAPAVVGRALAAPDVDPMAAQFLPQFRPLMKTELHLLLTVTAASPEQRKAIVANREKATIDAAKLYAQSQQRMGRFMNTNTYPQPRKLIQESLLAIAKLHLSAEQLARYQDEINRGVEDQKQLAIKNIIAKMDQDLVLSEDQRDKLAASLAKNWNAAWCQSLEMFMYGDQFFPAIPDNLVLPTLNPKQKQVWAGTQRNNGVIFGGFNNILGNAEGDDVFPKDEQPEEHVETDLPKDVFKTLKAK